MSKQEIVKTLDCGCFVTRVKNPRTPFESLGRLQEVCEKHKKQAEQTKKFVWIGIAAFAALVVVFLLFVFKPWKSSCQMLYEVHGVTTPQCEKEIWERIKNGEYK